MGVRFCQRDLYHASAIVLGGHHAELEAGIGSDVSFLRAGKGQNTECERRSRSDGCGNVSGIEALHLREGVDQIVGEIVGVASALREDASHGVAR